MVVIELEGECTHETFATALAEIDLTENYDQRLAFLFKGECFFDASCIASIVAWGKRYKSTGGTIEFVGFEEAMNYLSRMDVFQQLDFGYQELFNRQNEKGRFLPVFPVQNEDSVVAATEAICRAWNGVCAR